MWPCGVDASPPCIRLLVPAGHEGVSHSPLLAPVAALLSNLFKCPAIWPCDEYRLNIWPDLSFFAPNTGWSHLKAQTAKENCCSVLMAHKSRQMQVLIFFLVTSFYPDLLPFFRNLFYILLAQQNSPPQRKKAKLFLDKSVICLPQNGKFNHTNDCTNGCGGWFFTSRMMSLRMRRSSAAVVHCPEARRTALPWTNPARL